MTLTRTRLLTPLAAALLAALPLASMAQASATITVGNTPLIPRSALFGNPVKAGAQLSPNGQWLSWMAPVNGVMNVWVAPSDKPGEAKAITASKDRPIPGHFWSGNSEQLLFVKDNAGDENFRLYGVDVKTGTQRDYTPFDKVRVRMMGTSRKRVDEVLVGVNNRDPRWHDVHLLNLKTGELTTLYDSCDGKRLIGPNDIVFDAHGGFWFTDHGIRDHHARTSDLTCIYYAKADGSKIEQKVFPLERPNGCGLSPDGNTLYVVETPTARLWAFDLSALRAVLSTGAILHEGQYRWAREQVGDLPLQSICGGTDILGCFVLGHPHRPVHPGQAQCRSLAMDVQAWRDGRPLGAGGGVGELVCANPFPSRPLGFHGDADGARFHAAYFRRHPGVWTHGDLVEFSAEGGARLHGRCDGLLYDDTNIIAMLQDPAWSREFEMPLQTLFVTPWSLALHREEAGGPFEAFVSQAVIDWHRSGLVADLERRWGIPVSAYSARMRTVWRQRGDKGWYCGDRVTQATPAECL